MNCAAVKCESLVRLMTSRRPSSTASGMVTRKYKFQGDVERGASKRWSGGGTGDGLPPGEWSVFRDSYSVFMGLLSPSLSYSGLSITHKFGSMLFILYL